MNPSEWARIAGIVESNYLEFDGFVVLHGSDTMSYSASALSFMLENL
jgi:L-asparaginase